MGSSRSYAVAGTALLLLALAAPAAAQEPQVEVLAEGLNAPRGITIAPDGSIYVAEAGAAGQTCMDEAAGGMCYGPSGSIVRIADGDVEPVIEGLTSAGAGPEVGGISDVAVAEDGTVTFVMNLGADPAVREGMPPEFADAGWLMQVGSDGTPVRVADVAAFESSFDSDAELGGEVDSNPYAVEIVDDGFVVADAGGNSILSVSPDGVVSLVAVIPFTTHEFSAAELAAMGPPPEGEGVPAEGETPAEGDTPADEMIPVPVQSVPTSVTLGPDGALYVGELTGGPFPVGGASVWRVAPGEEPSQYATGFTNIIGLGFAPDGTLYVAEMVHEGLMSLFTGGEAPPVGAVLGVAPGGGEPQLVATGDQFMALGGLAVDGDGNVYVSTNTLTPGAGAVLKITP